ncbi:MAG: hypothetical protein U1G07_07710 [Verrucomicrobiota bacterium]
MGPPVPFGTGPQAGYFDFGTVVLTNMGAGQVADIQLFVWEASGGGSFDEAVQTSSQRGISQNIQVRTGGEGDPPSPPAVLTGLKSFALSGPKPGLIDFRNYIPGVLDIPVEGADAPFVAQLYAGKTSLDLRPASLPTPFKRPRYWEPLGNGVVELPGITAGDFAWVQIRIWDGSVGTNYDQAVLLGSSGASPVIRVRTGGAGEPGMPGALLKSWFGYVYIHQPHAVSIRFQNLIPGTLDAPIFGRDGTRLAGTNFVAQLYADVFDNLHPVGEPVPFGVDAGAGYWQADDNPPIGVDVPVGCCATVQVRIWDASKGATYETCTGDKAVSRTAWFFATNEPQDLRELGLHIYGVTWVDDSPDPQIVITQYVGEGSWIEDVDNLPLTGTNWVAQVFVARVEADTYIQPGRSK